MEIRSLAFESRISVVYTVVFLSALLLFQQFSLRLSDIGHRIAGLKYIPLAFLIGAGLGFIEYHILRPDIQIEPVNMRNVFFSLIVFLAFTGYVEELIFRGLIQSLLERFMPITITVVYCNILFLIMHIIWGSILELAFVFCVGILLGFIFYRTRNLYLVSIIHGILNFHLFVMYPLLLS
jgi:membrane protease YdiL (CAAX protease family)